MQWKTCGQPKVLNSKFWSSQRKWPKEKTSVSALSLWPYEEAECRDIPNIEVNTIALRPVGSPYLRSSERNQDAFLQIKSVPSLKLSLVIY